MLRPQHVEQKQAYVDDSCKLLLHFNGQSGTQQFIDSSNNPKVVTAYGNACLSNSHYRFGGTSGYFDGDGDYLTAPYIILDGDFTFSFWLFSSTSGQENKRIFCNGNITTARFEIETETNHLTIYSPSTGHVELSTTNILDSAWHHCAVIRSGSTIRGYVDGVLGGTTATNSNSLGSSSSSTYIAALHDGSFGIIAYIDEFIIWNGIAKPIGELYPQLRPYGYPIGGT